MYFGWSLPLFRRNWLNLSLFTILLIPYCITLLLKIFFACVFLVSTEANYKPGEFGKLLESATNSLEMDRDRYPGNCLFKVEADNGGGGRGTEQYFVWMGAPYTAPSMRYPETMNLPLLLTLACNAQRSLKNE